MNNIFSIHQPPAIIREAEEHDRRECIALDLKVGGANRELAQWLIDHPSYPNTAVANWLGCDETRIRKLRKWAVNGFITPSHQSGAKRAGDSVTSPNVPLKTNDNFRDDNFEPGDDVEDSAQVLKNILDSIGHAKSVAEAYRKILKSSSFDRGAKAEIYNAINQLIVKWRSVQSTLDTKGQGNGKSKDY
jgi:hypothetical protein